MCLNVGSFEQRHTDSKYDPILDNVENSTFLNFGFGGDETVLGSSINGRHFLFPPSPLFSNYNKDLSCKYPSDMDKGQGRQCLRDYTIEGEEKMAQLRWCL